MSSEPTKKKTLKSAPKEKQWRERATKDVRISFQFIRWAMLWFIFINFLTERDNVKVRHTCIRVSATLSTLHQTLVVLTKWIVV